MISDPASGRYLLRWIDGLPPGALAREEGIEEAAFYRRLYRCREKSRARRSSMGIRA